jgi:hypothetical protein
VCLRRADSGVAFRRTGGGRAAGAVLGAHSGLRAARRPGKQQKQSDAAPPSGVASHQESAHCSFDYLNAVLWFHVVQLAELRRAAEGCGEWEWTRIIGTPASACMTSYWTAVAT